MVWLMVNSTLKCNTQLFVNTSFVRLAEAGICNTRRRLGWGQRLTPAACRTYTVLRLQVESADRLMSSF